MENPKGGNHGRKVKPATAENAATSTGKIATPIDETATANLPKSRGDAEQPGYTTVDQEFEAETVGATRHHPEIEQIANQLFNSLSYETLYFTSDRSGFGNSEDAYQHAKTLENKEIITIKRK